MPIYLNEDVEVSDLEEDRFAMALFTAWAVALLLVALVLVVVYAHRKREAFDRAALSAIGGERYHYVSDNDGRANYRPELRETAIERRAKAEAARKHANRVASGGAGLAAVEKRRA
jgi:hypothetical protein